MCSLDSPTSEESRFNSSDLVFEFTGCDQHEINRELIHLVKVLPEIASNPTTHFAWAEACAVTLNTFDVCFGHLNPVHKLDYLKQYDQTSMIGELLSYHIDTRGSLTPLEAVGFVAFLWMLMVHLVKLVFNTAVPKILSYCFRFLLSFWNLTVKEELESLVADQSGNENQQLKQLYLIQKHLAKYFTYTKSIATENRKQSGKIDCLLQQVNRTSSALERTSKQRGNEDEILATRQVVNILAKQNDQLSRQLNQQRVDHKRSTSALRKRCKQLNAFSDTAKSKLDLFTRYHLRQTPDCSVCMESFSGERVLAIINCIHPLCNICARHWLNKSKHVTASCPTCRTDYREEDILLLDS